MSTPMLLALVVAAVVVSLLISAASYTLMARWVRAEVPTFRRGLAVALFSAACSFVVMGWFQLSTNVAETNPGLFLLAAVVANILVPIIATAKIFRASLLRSIGIYLGASLLGGVAVVVIALAVKSTLVESFVVPTGSMAPTIRGDHIRYPCTNCGREMVVGTNGNPNELYFGPCVSVEGRCVNCGHINSPGVKWDYSDGERVAVDKVADVARWNLVLFRRRLYPEIDFERDYVKRFVGMPGEKVEWYGGELFANGKLLRKPPGRMDSLWFPVNDSAFAPGDPDAQKWKSDDNDPAWRRLDGQWRGIPTKDAAARLQFAGEIGDLFEYNAAHRQEKFIVTDVMVRLTEVRMSSRVLAIDWKFGGTAVRFEIDADAAELRIRQYEPVVREIDKVDIDAASLKLEPIEFAVRDGQAYVRQSGVTIASGEFGPTTLAEYRGQYGAPRKQKEECSIEITAHGEQVAIGRIELFRDIYYLTSEELGVDAPDDVAWLNDAVQLGDDEYLALGDNSDSALDSRFWGPVPRNNVAGVVKWLYWPPSRAQEFE